MSISEKSTCNSITSISDLVLAVDHMAIAVRDLEEGIRWYSEGLGFELIERRETQGESTSMISAVMSLGPICIVLICGTSPESQVSKFIQNFGPGVQHIAFSVSDLDQALQRLKSAGGDCETPVFSDEGIRQVFLRRDEGSGVRVELIERSGGTFTDESVKRLFRAFEKQGLW